MAAKNDLQSSVDLARHMGYAIDSKHLIDKTLTLG